MVADDTTDARRDVLPRILKSIHWQTKQSNLEVMLNRSHGNKNITAPWIYCSAGRKRAQGYQTPSWHSRVLRQLKILFCYLSVTSSSRNTNISIVLILNCFIVSDDLNQNVVVLLSGPRQN